MLLESWMPSLRFRQLAVGCPPSFGYELPNITLCYYDKLRRLWFSQTWRWELEPTLHSTAVATKDLAVP